MATQEKKQVIGVEIPNSMNADIIAAGKKIGMKKSEYIRLAIINQLARDHNCEQSAVYRRIANNIVDIING